MWPRRCSDQPSGRLPLTYPAAQDGGGVPYWHAVTDQCTAPADLAGLPRAEIEQDDHGILRNHAGVPVREVLAL